MPSSPTSRLLELLELLQTQPLVTGREIADRLDVDRRTVRRDVATLQQLGIPVEGERGVGGGYRLRPGYRLPPLMLSDDEATAFDARPWPSLRKRFTSFPVSMPTGQAVAHRPSVAQVLRAW